MKRPTLLSFAAVLAVLGLADAFYLAETAMRGADLTCNISGLDGCNLVAKSEYAHFFGIPLGVYGVVFYLLFVLLIGLAFWKPMRKVDLALVALGAVGISMSAYFLYIQLVLIQAVCVYCLASAVIAALLFAVVSWLTFRKRPEAIPVPAST